MRACAEFSARVAAGEQTALIDTCASLRASIDRAVFLGRLTSRRRPVADLRARVAAGHAAAVSPP